MVVFSGFIVSDILPYLAPVAFINLVPATPVCDGELITVISNVVNGGVVPTFQWLLNNQPVGAGLDSLVSIFSDGDSIKLILTSSYQCLSKPSDTSNIVVS